MQAKRQVAASPSEQPSRAVIHIRTSVMHDVLEVLGDAWTLRILQHAGAGPVRFETLLTQLEIPRATLSSRLRALLGKGCVARTTYSKNATRFEYRLTPKGQAALPAVLLLHQWNRRRARASSPAVVKHACGARLDLEAICGGCGRSILSCDVKALDFEPISHLEKLPAPPKVRRGRQVLEARAKGDLDAESTITAEDCIGDRWASLVIGTLMFGLRRFVEIENAIAIAPNILSSRLQLLARVGIVERRLPLPGRATYHLTAKGNALFPAIMALCAWGDAWLRVPTIVPSGKTKSAAKQAASWGLLHRPCGAWLRTEVICKPCGAELAEKDLE